MRIAGRKLSSSAVAEHCDFGFEGLLRRNDSSLTEQARDARVLSWIALRGEGGPSLVDRSTGRVREGMLRGEAVCQRVGQTAFQ